ncbi:MAG: hypothetical protein H6609_17920 [Ignavibacteriales bacterium]|nr:hypothetical protein [Ignavibacteriales bacterium]
MKQKLIPIKIEQPSAFRRYNPDNPDKKEDFDLDFGRIESKVLTAGPLIKGIIKIPTSNDVKISFIPTDKIYNFSENLNFVERLRNEDELSDNMIWGRFQYSKSIVAIDGFMFNRNIGLHKYYHSKLHKICSDLIYQELRKL